MAYTKFQTRNTSSRSSSAHILCVDITHKHSRTSGIHKILQSPDQWLTMHAKGGQRQHTNTHTHARTHYTNTHTPTLFYTHEIRLWVPPTDCIGGSDTCGGEWERQATSERRDVDSTSTTFRYKLKMELWPDDTPTIGRSTKVRSRAQRIFTIDQLPYVCVLTGEREPKPKPTGLLIKMQCCIFSRDFLLKPCNLKSFDIVVNDNIYFWIFRNH